MWTVIYMTKDENDISLLKSKLKENNVITMVRSREEYFEVLVPSSEMAVALDIVIETEI